MAKLIGNKPDQVPTNGDLGTLAFQDSDNVIVENLTVSGSSSKLVVSDGSVGIGTSSPSRNLHISASTPIIRLEDSDGTNQYGEIITSGASLILQSRNDTLDGNILFRGVGGGSTTEFVRISSSGNVGIGTSSPDEKLHVDSGYIKLSRNGDVDQHLLLDDNSSAGCRIYSHSRPDNAKPLVFNATTDTSNTTATSGSPSIIFLTYGVERIRFDSSGNVGIGTGPSISYQLQLSTDSAGKPSTNTWTVVSDERIKENIELADLDLCYDAVKNIPLKRFKWKDDVYSEEQVADRHKLGWIAQDVETVYPKAVNIHEFRYNQVYSDVIIPAVDEELDEDGNVITEAQEERIEKELVSEEVIEDCRNLNADQIYAAMYGAIQKLIQKVETLETRIAELEA